MTRPRADLDVSSTLLDPAAYPGDDPLSWPALFGDDRPVVVEIGSGKGLFLANAAAARPDHGFFGIEIAKKYARVAAERLVKAELTNVRMWPADASRLMDRRIVPASLREVHVYFPDPWWKKRHKKRRVFNEALVGSIARALVPGGELHVATDVEEYFGVIRELLASDARFSEIQPPPLGDPENDHDYLTNFERKYRIEGRPVYRVSYGLKPALSTERLLPAGPQEVFAAFEDPDRLARWWGPEGFTNTFQRFQFETGGSWVFTMHGPNGVDHPNESVFREIERERRVVIEHVSPPRFTLVVTLTQRGDHTHLSWVQVFEDAEVAARLAPICRPANEQNLDRLQALLAGADEAR